MSMISILFVEDDASGREVGSFNLRKAGYQVEAAESAEIALELFDKQPHDLVITDLRMPGMSGLDLLRAIKKRCTKTPVLVITAYGSIDTAVEAMKQGAYDFIGKPFNREHLLLTVKRALESRRLREELRTLRVRASGVERPMVCVSEAMKRVIEIVDRVAPTDASVLVTGESGTGKELVARRLHARSARAEHPFVAINCAAVPSELIESELFGHEKGAFTGAHKARKGRFRQAEGGTILLDEIAELPMASQGKLLRVLQERVVDTVGLDQPTAVDVRVLAATNKDLADRVAHGRFREDLFYRLNVVEVQVPPLRERPAEIDALVVHFVEELASGRQLVIPAELLETMRARPWPGNVRQLRNACERLVILCPGSELRIDDLPPAERSGSRASEAPPASSTGQWPPLPAEGLGLVDLEKKVISRVLELKNGNVSQAAAYLKVPRHILAYRLTKYGIGRD